MRRIAAGAVAIGALLAPAPAAAQDLTPIAVVVAPTLLFAPALLAFAWSRLLDAPRRPRPSFAGLWLASALEVALWLATAGFLLVALFFGRWWSGVVATAGVAAATGWTIQSRRLRGHGESARSWRVAAAAAFAPVTTLLAILASWGVFTAVGR